MIPSKAALVVPPGYPVELIQELLRARILPPSADMAVLLPPEETSEYRQLIDQQDFFGVRFLPSPGRKFFSTPHLKWLEGHLRSSQINMVLIFNSLDRDLTSALVALTTLLLSGKSITHYRQAQARPDENQETVLDSTDEMSSGPWTSKELNPKMLAREIFTRVTLAPPGHPWKFNEILYFLMFSSLVIKQHIKKIFFLLHIRLRKM